MGLIDLFNQWIVERGSAVVQEKHLALFKDQLVVADKKISLLESENVVLKTEINDLKAQSRQLIKENTELKKKTQAHENTSHGPTIDEAKVKILIYLASEHNVVFPLQSIMQNCNLSEQAALYHLRELEDDCLIESEFVYGSDHWNLDHDGRGYLIEHKLIP